MMIIILINYEVLLQPQAGVAILLLGVTVILAGCYSIMYHVLVRGTAKYTTSSTIITSARGRRPRASSSLRLVASSSTKY